MKTKLELFEQQKRKVISLTERLLDKAYINLNQIPRDEIGYHLECERIFSLEEFYKTLTKNYYKPKSEVVR